MKRFAVLLIVLLFAACGSTLNRATQPVAQQQTNAEPGLSPATKAATNAKKAATTRGPATAGVATGAAPTTGTEIAAGSAAGGVTSTKGPIEIGIILTGVSNAKAFGVSAENTVQEKDVDNAAIKQMNAEGGLAGRKIVPVYASTDTGSQSWDADYAAACETFTHDNHVAAVLGYSFNFDPGFESCLNKHGIPHLSTAFNVPDKAELAKYPLLFNLSTPRIERRSIEKIDGGLKTNVLTKTNRLGIVLDECPGTLAAWNNVTKPYITSKGLNIASTFQIACAHGAGDVATIAGQAGNLVLQFRTANVDRMLVMGVSEGPPVLIIGNAAEGQGWHPWYVVSSLAQAATLGGQMPEDQAQNIHGYGWLPMQDVNPAQWPPLSTSAKRCRTMLAKQGVNLQTATDWSLAFNICEVLFLYNYALTQTHGRAWGPAIAGAIEPLGTRFVSAMNLEGKTVFSREQHDSPTLARYFSWEHACTCFKYRSTTFPIR